MTHRDRWAGLSAVVYVAGLALAVTMSASLGVTDDEITLTGIADRFVDDGVARRELPGHPTLSRFPAGVFLHMTFGLTQLIAPGVASARVMALGLLALSTAYLALVIAREISARYAFWFLLMYWVSPWTLYHGAMAWEPALMLTLGSLVFAMCLGMRKQPDFRRSAILGYLLTVAAQVHGAAIVPLMTVAYLALRRTIWIVGSGILVGVLLGALTLVPDFNGRGAAAVGETLSTRHPDSHVGFGLVHVYPVIRAAGFWLRMGSSDMNRQMRQNRLYEGGTFGHRSGDLVVRVFMVAVTGLSFVSVLVSVVASVWFLGKGALRSARPPMVWMRTYSRVSLAALLVSAALSPVCIQGWHSVVASSAASVPVAAWCERHCTTSRAAMRALVVGLVALRVAVILAVAIGRHTS